MLMPFFESSKESATPIDYSKHQPVSVIASFNREGKILPVYLGIMDLYGNACKVKIDGISFTKGGKDHITYCCLYNSNKLKRQLKLTYFINEHLWALDN
jgi:hypothetical protein